MAPKIVGIVNVTEDSFSDGGLYLDPGKAADHAFRLAEEGADVVELGPASSHPDSAEVPPAEEVRRLGAVLDRITGLSTPVGVDSFHPEAQAYAIERGVAYLNDIQGFPDAGLDSVLARADCRLVVMHSVQGRGRATRVPAEAGPVLSRIERFFENRVERLTSSGVDRERILLDPGMGFFLGSSPEPSVEVLRSLPQLKRRFALPLWISVSRKSFLAEITGRTTEALGPATLAAELYAAAQGADWIRTHDVRALRDALRVGTFLRS